ncbi:glycosyltransferase family 2 protein [Parabacteroides sp.]
MNIKVSIIIPVYNVAPYLDACLSSCINQTFRDIEIIVVNDGSTDASYQVITKYTAMDKRIVVVNKENEGLIYARKSGLDIARGEYVFHLDGDDYIENNTIDILYQEAIKNNSDCVMAGFYWVFGENKREHHWDQHMNGLSKQDLLSFLIDKGLWPIWGKLMRKSLFDDIIYRKVFIGEDLYLNMQISLKIENLLVSDFCLYNYVRQENAITMKKDDDKVFGLCLEMLEAAWSLLDIYPFEERIRKQICYLFIPLLIGAIKENRIKVKSILIKYYWNKKETRDYLWRDKKLFYFLCGGYIYAPHITSLGTKIGVKAKALLRKVKH